MTDERLHFSGENSHFHAYLASQHIVRYATVQKLVDGKRVLDVACGEGYGCNFLVTWGAREVTGIDLSKSAIRSANKHFVSAENTSLKFLQGNIERLSKVLGDTKPFDVITSFETIEHLHKPEEFLQSLTKYTSEDTIIAISCPNDQVYEEKTGHSNDYHLSKMSFRKFKELTETYLGSATQWLLGTPLNGEMNYEIGNAVVENEHTDMLSITRVEEVDSTILVPSQRKHAPSEHTCSHYIGIWNAKVSSNAAVSAISVPPYISPWIAIAEYEKTKKEWWEPRIEHLEKCILEKNNELDKNKSIINIIYKKIKNISRKKIFRNSK